ncbi:Ig-like group 2 protein [Vibrio phage 393E50-1]|nr:Ig-like group 2 protein [Vibrio phage 393E50-1]
MAGQNSVLIAGTIVEQQKPDGSWKRVPRITALGATGEQAESKEKTAIEDTIRKYGSGLREAPDKNLSGQYIPPQKVGDEYELDRALQQDFIARCRGEEEFYIRITFPDLERCKLQFKALGYQVDDGTQEDWKIFTANGKQNSRPEWSEAAAMTGMTIGGGDTVATSATLQLTVETVPLDAYYVPGLEFETSDSSIATVSPSGLVTGVKAGSVDITVTFNGMDEVHSITVS